jgi:hypothetical protein
MFDMVLPSSDCCCCCAACTSPPSGTNLPANAAWGCTGSTQSGGTCSAVCDSGYTAKPGTLLQATCSLGSWGTQGAQGSQGQMECLPNRELVHAAAMHRTCLVACTRT